MRSYFPEVFQKITSALQFTKILFVFEVNVEFDFCNVDWGISVRRVHYSAETLLLITDISESFMGGNFSSIYKLYIDNPEYIWYQSSLLKPQIIRMMVLKFRVLTIWFFFHL